MSNNKHYQDKKPIYQFYQYKKKKIYFLLIEKTNHFLFKEETNQMSIY